MIILLLLVFVIVALRDAPELIRRKHWKELAVYSVLFLLAFVVAFLQVTGVEIPSPIKQIQFFLKNILHLYYP